MKPITSLFSLAIFAAAGMGCAGWASPAVSPAGPAGPDPDSRQTGGWDEVRNIILMIADGAGAGLWTAAEYAKEELAVKQLPVVGLVDTRSATHKVTDSAAGATVYATGERVMNRTISVGPASACPLPTRSAADETAWPEGCKPLQTWFEIARDKGRATGLVTTTHVVDATPAAFVAHSPSRYRAQEIAGQFADFGLDVLLGGGRAHFVAAVREDGRELLGTMCERADCVGSAEELNAYIPGEHPLIGLFTSGDMDAYEPRPVSVPDMVRAALAKLERRPEGFVAMFETEATDNSTHANAPLERVTADMLEFDRAVAVAHDFARRTPGTLLIVTSDHETGGFSLVEQGFDYELRYSTHGHGADAVPLFAYGPQAGRFGGWRENYEIGQTLMEITEAW